VLRQFVLHFRFSTRLFQAPRGAFTRVLTARIRLVKTGLKICRILGEASATASAPLDTLDDSRHYFAKSGTFDAVAQVDQRFDERHPGPMSCSCGSRS